MNIKCKIICINNKIPGDQLTMGELSITIGKEYETYYELFNIDRESFIYLPIVDDAGYMRLYPKDFFMSKEEYRNQKLGILVFKTFNEKMSEKNYVITYLGYKTVGEKMWYTLKIRYSFISQIPVKAHSFFKLLPIYYI